MGENPNNFLYVKLFTNWWALDIPPRDHWSVSLNGSYHLVSKIYVVKG